MVRRLFLSLALLLGGCNTLSEDERLRLRVFDTYVGALAADYPFFAQKHIDWAGLADAYRSAVVSAERREQFYHLLAGMFAELDDPHVSLDVPLKNWCADGQPSSSLLDLPGFRVRIVDRRVLVVGWPDGGAPVVPEQLPEGQRDLPELVRMDGARVTPPLLGVLAMGSPSVGVELQLRWSDGTRTRHVLARPEVRDQVLRLGGERTLAQVVTTEAWDGRAIVRIDTLDPADCKVDAEAMTEHMAAALTAAQGERGLVIDLRANGGGNVGVLRRVIGRFLPRRVEVVLAAERESWLLGLFTREVFRHLVLEPASPRLASPVVVWTSGHTGSAAELLARLLQRECGAVVIGERTAGAEAMLVRIEGEDGTGLTFGRDRVFDRGGIGIQDEGITPDVAVRLTADDIRRCGGYERARADWNRRLRVASAAAFAAMAAPAGRDG